MQQEPKAKVMLTRRGKEMSRSGMISRCSAHALAKLKLRYYAEYLALYEQEIESAGIKFNFENKKVLQRENTRLKELLRQNGIQV
jgi:hypothetical protein